MAHIKQISIRLEELKDEIYLAARYTLLENHPEGMYEFESIANLQDWLDIIGSDDPLAIEYNELTTLLKGFGR